MRSIYVAGSAEVNHNWLENRANRWYKAGLNAEDKVGQYRFSAAAPNMVYAANQA